MKKKLKVTFVDKTLWIFASIIEWISIPLYILAMGYDINFELYNRLKEWEYIVPLFYVLSAFAATMFLYFAFKFRRMKLKKETIISEISCIFQLILIILKVKI